MEAGTLKDDLTADIIRLLGDAFAYPTVFEQLARHLVTSDVAVRAVRSRDARLAAAVLQVALDRGQHLPVTVELAGGAIGDGRFDVAVTLLGNAPQDVLAAAFSTLRFRPLYLTAAHNTAMAKLIPAANTSILHLAVLMNARHLVHRLLAVTGLVPQETLAGLPSFAVMHQPSMVVDLYTPPLLCPPTAYAADEPHRWLNHTRLSPLHWALCLPGRVDLVPHLLRELGPNTPAAIHTRPGLLGSSVRNWCVTEKVDVLAPCPDTLGIVEELHPVAFPVAFLCPKLEAMTDDERLGKMLDVLHAPGLVLDIHSIVYALECMLRRQLWGETGVGRQVYEALFQCLPAGARVPLHHAFPLGMHVGDAALRRTSFFVSHLLDAFVPSLDLNSCNENGMAPLHIAAYYSSVLVAEALLAHPALDANTRSHSLVAPGTAVNVAAAHGNQDVLLLLLKHPVLGAETCLVERELRSRRTALHHACDRLQFPSASLLADRCGLAVSDFQSAPSLLTPLHHLLRAGMRCVDREGVSDTVISSIDAVACRLLSPKSIALPDRHGDTTLHLACRLGCVDYIRGAAHSYTRKFGEAVGLRSAKGETVLHHCARSASPTAAEAIKVILANTPRADCNSLLEAVDNEGHTALHAALRCRYAPGVVIAALIDAFPIGHDAASAYGVYHGATALATPSAIANLAPQAMAKLVFPDKSGRNALHHFARAADLASLQACLMKVASVAEAVGVRDRGGDTILHLLLHQAGTHTQRHTQTTANAADNADSSEGAAAYAEKVLRGLPVDVQRSLMLALGSGGRGLIHLAAAARARGFVEYALTVLHGQTWCFESDAGTTPAQEALLAHDPQLAWLLWRREMARPPIDEDGRDVLLQSAAEGSLDLFQDVLSTVGLVDVNVRDAHGSNVVHCCAEDRIVGSAKLATLAARGVLSMQEFNARNANDETPLQIAVENNIPEGVSVLINLGVDVRPSDLEFPVRYGCDDVVHAVLAAGPAVPPGVIGGSVRTCRAATTVALMDASHSCGEDDVFAALAAAYRHCEVAPGGGGDGGRLQQTVAAEVAEAGEGNCERRGAGAASTYERRRRARIALSVSRAQDRLPPADVRAEEMRALLMTLHPRCASAQAALLLIESVDNWLKGNGSAARPPTAGCITPEQYVSLVLQPYTGTPAVRAAAGVESEWFKLFSFVIIGGLLRSLHGVLSTGDWRLPTSQVSAFSDLPRGAQARCPVLHRAVLVLFASVNAAGGPEASLAARAFRLVTWGTAGGAAAVVEAMYLFPGFADTIAMLADASPECREAMAGMPEARLTQMAVAEGGRGGALRAAVGRRDVPQNIVKMYALGQHSHDNDLLLDILNYRPDVDEGLLTLLRDREMLDLRTPRGDTLMHLLIMTDRPELLQHVTRGELDYEAKNHAGLTPADYCKSGAMMRALVALGGEPSLPSMDHLEYVICLTDVIKPTCMEDPGGYLGRKLGRCVQKLMPSLMDTSRAEHADGLRELEEKLLAQRVMIYKSPQGVPGVWGLHIPLRKALEVALEYGAATGGYGAELEEMQADEDTAIETVKFTKLQRIRFLKLVLNPFRSGVDLVAQQTAGSIKSVFPVYLHDHEEARPIQRTLEGTYPFNRLFAYWGVSKISASNPLSKVKAYCGEHLAFYFAWLSVYEAWLVLQLFPAIAFAVVQYVVGFDHPSMGLFAALMIIWGIVFAKCWARREAEFGVQWQVYARPILEPIRSSFQPMQLDDGRFMSEPNIFNPEIEDPFFPPAKRRARYILSVVTLAVGLAIAAVEFVFYMELRKWVQDMEADGDATASPTLSPAVAITLAPGVDLGTNASVTAAAPVDPPVPPGGNWIYLSLLSVGHTLAILIIEKVYRAVSDVLAEYENHKYQRNFADSLVLKYMALQLITAFVPPMAIIYDDTRVFGADVGFRNASLHVTVKLLSEATIGALNEYILPGILKMCCPPGHTKIAATMPRAWAALVDYARCRHGETYATDDFRLLYGEFSEIVIQIAYVVCFAAICPLAGVIALINNYIEIRGDLSKALSGSRRPLPDRSRGVGSWATLVKTIVACAIPINTFCMLQSPAFVDTLGYSKPEIFLAVQVGFFAVYWMYHTFIPSSSHAARRAIQIQEAQRDKKHSARVPAHQMAEQKKTV